MSEPVGVRGAMDWLDQLEITSDGAPARLSYAVERLPDGSWLCMAVVDHDGARRDVRRIIPGR